MCLYVNKTKTVNNKPKTAKTYYKLVRCYKGSKEVKAPFQSNKIESGWYKPDYESEVKNPELEFSLNGGLIHVCCTKAEAEKLKKSEHDCHILEVKCYPEDFVAFGAMSSSIKKTAPQAAYKKIFIQEDDLRDIIRRQNRKR